MAASSSNEITEAFLHIKDYLSDAYLLYETPQNTRSGNSCFVALDYNLSFQRLFVKRIDVALQSIDPYNLRLASKLLEPFHRAQNFSTEDSSPAMTRSLYCRELKLCFKVTVIPQQNNRYSAIFHRISEKLRPTSIKKQFYINPRSENLLSEQNDNELHHIKESLSRAQLIAHVGNWEFDIIHNIAYWSDELYRIYGYEPKEFVSFPDAFQKHIHPEDRQTLEQAIVNVWSDNEYNIEVRIIRKDHRVCWIHDQAKIEYNSAGKPIRIYGTIQDITDRKLMELRLKDSEEKYRMLIDNMVPGLAYFKLVKNPEGKVIDYVLVDVNNAYEIMSGRTKEEAIGRLATDINDSILNDGSYFLDLLGSVSQSGNSFSVEQFKYNRWFNVILYAPMEGYIAALFTDITSRKNLENDLIAAKEAAEDASLSKSEFLATISHELRTPLNVILSAIQLFNLYLDRDDMFNKENASRHLKSMRQNCLRLIRLVNNILDSNKIDAGHFELNLQNLDIVNVIRNISDSVDAYISQKHIQMEFKSTMRSKIIACDLNVIERIMLNLLSNAIKFTRENGNIKIKIYKEKGMIHISIRDDGIGIAANMQELVFERFKQANNLLTREHEGSGIGLSITKTLVELLDGSIVLKSREEQGSEFIVKIPDQKIPDTSSTWIEEPYSTNLVERINVEFSDIYYVS